MECFERISAKTLIASRFSTLAISTEEVISSFRANFDAGDNDMALNIAQVINDDEDVGHRSRLLRLRG